MVQRIRGGKGPWGWLLARGDYIQYGCCTASTICCTGNVFNNSVGENMESNSLIATGIFKFNKCTGLVYVRPEKDKYTFRM